MRATDVDGKVHLHHAINEVALFRQTYQAARLRILIDERERMAELIADGILADVQVVHSIAHGTLRVTDRAPIERCLRPRPLKSMRYGINRPHWHRYTLMKGWEVFYGRKRLEALYFAAHAVGSTPWRHGGWRLLGAVAFKPLPRLE